MDKISREELFFMAETAGEIERYEDMYFFIKKLFDKFEKPTVNEAKLFARCAKNLMYSIRTLQRTLYTEIERNKNHTELAKRLQSNLF